MKFTALLTGLVLALHSVLAAALFEASNSSGLIIRSDDPHNVVAFKQLLNDTIDGDLLNGFMEKAKTLVSS